MVKDVVVVGGGLAGLINSILLARGGLDVVLVEKKAYPFHRVCGEYISNETLPFLEKHGLFPADIGPARIEHLMITSTSGKHFSAPLDLGGFGVSRYAFDHWLSRLATKAGVKVKDNTTVKSISYQQDEDVFLIKTKTEELQARLVIGAFGKRSKLDKELQRSFIDKRSPYVGVKYHIRTDANKDTVALHNFKGGYCGISRIEEEKYNLCYLTERSALRKYGDIEEFENQVLNKNPWLEDLFKNSDFLLEKPEVINEISFEKKEAVYQHVLMSGDSAGMITPLCGNGMAMAIHSAKMLTETILHYWNGGRFDRHVIEENYQLLWRQLFEKRLWAGRQIQANLFGRPLASELAVLTGKYAKAITRSLIKLTHGSPFG